MVGLELVRCDGGDDGALMVREGARRASFDET